ncbi:MAG: RHS repeat-associated core domain-containing protein [Gammaproteobacteria bacterium]
MTASSGRAANPNINNGVVTWSSETHDLFIGDTNNDALPDIYLQGRTLTIDGAQYTAESVLLIAENHPQRYRQVAADNVLTNDQIVPTSQWLVGDLDGDANPDVVILPNTVTSQGAIVLSGNATRGPMVTQTLLPEALGLTLETALSGNLALSDHNQDGRLDLVNTADRLTSEYGTLEGSVNTATRYYYPHTDHLGTIRVVTDEAGQVVWEADLAPFGEVSYVTAEIEQPLRFQGQYYDAESGLYYNYFRDYDPSIGRYVQSDPIGLHGGLNTYAYVGGNPIGYIDPYGESATAAVGGWIGTDTAIPDPTDAAWPKWVDYGAALGGAALIDWLIYNNENSNDDGDQCPVDKDNPPNHPDFVPDKREKIPWNKNRKGFKDKSGNYWEPVPDGHKGTHDPHWDVQKPNGSHTPVYPPKN